MKVLYTLLLGSLFATTTWFSGVGKELITLLTPTQKPVQPELLAPPQTLQTVAVSDVVTAALAFKNSLTTTQQGTLQQAYTTTLARKWSNLPCGSGCRNGIQFSALNSSQLTLALEVVRLAYSSVSNEGAAEFYQLRLADKVLNQQYNGGSGYDSSIYFMAFLNQPSTTSGWMLQFGGHHFAANIAFNNGNVTSVTPSFRGVEPTSFTVGGTTYAPLDQELNGFRNLLASFTTAQLGTAQITNVTYSDCQLSPGESNGNNKTFPTTRVGIPGSSLTTAQLALLTTAIEPYISDADDASAATLRAIYANGLSGTYVSYTGSGTSGTASSFLNANTNYVRIDGPEVWIEFICQTGAVIQSQIHYHTVYRDRNRDYGKDLTTTTLPVRLTGFEGKSDGGVRVLSWTTAQEENLNRFELERSVSATGDFKTIATQKAHNTASDYSLTDKEVLSAAVLYYHLKMVDNDGQLSYSKVVAVRNGTIKSFSVYPNPARTTVSLLPGAELSDARVRVSDAQGKVLISRSHLKGSRIELTVNQLAPGTYFVQLTEGDQTYSSTFVRE